MRPYYGPRLNQPRRQWPMDIRQGWDNPNRDFQATAEWRRFMRTGIMPFGMIDRWTDSKFGTFGPYGRPPKGLDPRAAEFRPGVWYQGR